MKKNNKAVAVRKGGEVALGDLSERLKAFRAEMQKNGLTSRNAGKWLSIDMDGGFVIATYKTSAVKPSKKYKKTEHLYLTLDVQKGFGNTADGDAVEVKPGEYTLRADGNIPAWHDRVEPKAGDVVAFHFREKAAPSKDFPKGVKSYEILDNCGQ